MTKKEDIINLLIDKHLTALQIHEKLNIPKDKLWIYLNTLKNEKKIVVINQKKPYIYKAITPLALLNFMNELFKNNIEYLMENPEIDKFIEQNEDTFNKIEEMIVNAKSE